MNKLREDKQSYNIFNNYAYTVTHKSTEHIGLFKKIINSIIATDLKLDLNIVIVRICYV